jgi:Thioredoxin
MTYPAYRQLVTQLLAEGKQTGAGVPDTPEMLEYTRLNEQRMKRLEKTFKPDSEAMEILQQINAPMLWLVITEGWCGDAAQIVPVLQHVADHTQGIELRLILRDQHLDIMDAFLTNGGRSIPKVLFVAPDSGQILGHWGPRPVDAQKEMATYSALMKAAPDEATRKEHYEAAKTAIHTWYAHDKTISTQREVATAALAAMQQAIAV